MMSETDIKRDRNSEAEVARWCPLKTIGLGNTLDDLFNDG